MKTIEEVRLEIYVLEAERNELEKGEVTVELVEKIQQLTTRIWKKNRKLSKIKVKNKKNSTRNNRSVSKLTFSD